MSEYQYFWCDDGTEYNWMIINLDRISSIRYSGDDQKYYYVVIDGDGPYRFSHKEIERLLKAMGRVGHKLFDNDGKQL